jgi:hypothetical protein
MTAGNRHIQEEKTMVSIDQIAEHIEHTIAEQSLAGDREGLRQTQWAATVITSAAEASGDNETALRFRKLAAYSANKQEDLAGED